MVVMLIIACIIGLAAVLACCKVSGDCARNEERQNPCDSCNRWSECNGVDEGCPWRNNNG